MILFSQLAIGDRFKVGHLPECTFIKVPLTHVDCSTFTGDINSVRLETGFFWSWSDIQSVTVIEKG